MSHFLFCFYSEIPNWKQFKRERVYSELHFKGTIHQNGDVKTTGKLVISYPQLEVEHHGCKQTAKLTSLTVSSVCDWAFHCYLFSAFSLVINFWMSSVQIKVSDEDWELQQSICKEFTYNLYAFSMHFYIYQKNSRFITGADDLQSYELLARVILLGM